MKAETRENLIDAAVILFVAILICGGLLAAFVQAAAWFRIAFGGCS